MPKPDSSVMYLKTALFIPAFHLKITLQIKAIKMVLYFSVLISLKTYKVPTARD